MVPTLFSDRTSRPATGTVAWLAALGSTLFVLGGARAALLPGATPTTWTVAPDGSGDFTEIQPAIDAAVDGDTVLIAAGSYGSFTLGEDLTLVGEVGVKVQTATVTGVTGAASLADLAFETCTVTGCPGTVVLDRLLGTGPFFWQPRLTILNCADVRVLELDGSSTSLRPQVLVDASHAELVSSTARGREGTDETNAYGYAGDGGAGIEVRNGGRAYIARTQAQGGVGGDQLSLLGGYGGEGGAGIEVASGGDALVMGRGAELFKGGRGGWSISIYGYSGDGGDGARVSGAASRLRHSQVKFAHGGGGGGNGVKGSKGQAIGQVGGKVATPPTPDPTLERVTTPAAGGTVTFKLRSHPGAFSRLFVGSTPIVKPTPGVFVDKLVVPDTTYAVGQVSSTGISSYTIPLDPLWTVGATVHVQAMSIFPGGKIKRTNSVPVVVR